MATNAELAQQQQHPIVLVVRWALLPFGFPPPRTIANSLLQLTRAVKSPRVVTLTALWLFGLYACMLASAPTEVSPAMQALFDQKRQGFFLAKAAATERRKERKKERGKI